MGVSQVYFCGRGVIFLICKYSQCVRDVILKFGGDVVSYARPPGGGYRLVSFAGTSTIKDEPESPSIAFYS